MINLLSQRRKVIPRYLRILVERLLELGFEK